MKVLVACETSGVVRRAFRSNGHSAFSCDIMPSDDNPKYHLQLDAIQAIRQMEWDLIIAHPPCTHLACSGARWFLKKRKAGLQQQGILFFESLRDAAKLSAPRYAIENPIGIMSTLWRKPDQIIQPWQFGHGEVKATCLWLKGLPLLRPTQIVDGREPRIHKLGPSKDRSKIRGITYKGIADAMANQWTTCQYQWEDDKYIQKRFAFLPQKTFASLPEKREGS